MHWKQAGLVSSHFFRRILRYVSMFMDSGVFRSLLACCTSSLHVSASLALLLRPFGYCGHRRTLIRLRAEWCTCFIDHRAWTSTRFSVIRCLFTSDVGMWKRRGRCVKLRESCRPLIGRGVKVLPARLAVLVHEAFVTLILRAMDEICIKRESRPHQSLSS